MEAALNQLGITRYEQIAGWMRADVQRVGQALGIGGRINQENWIEQAAVLAKGGETYYSDRRARGETASAAPTPDEGAAVASSAPPAASLPRPMSRAGVSAAVVAPATGARKPAPVAGGHGFADGGRARRLCRPTDLPPDTEDAPLDAVPGPALPVRPVTPARDNLQRIGVITADIEQGLNAQGVVALLADRAMVARRRRAL